METQATNKIEAGTILVSLSGYEQTNVEFFRVEKVTASGFAVIAHIESDVVQEGNFRYRATPVVDSAPKGKLVRRKIQDPLGRYPFVMLNSYQHLSACENRPYRGTTYG
jgi:hypothetical protein